MILVFGFLKSGFLKNFNIPTPLSSNEDYFSYDLLKYLIPAIIMTAAIKAAKIKPADHSIATSVGL